MFLLVFRAIGWRLLTRNSPSVVPRPALKPCCRSKSCFSYQSLMRLMIMTTISLHSVEPICNPLYVVGSSALPLDGPFHRATSLEWPQFSGIWLLSQTSLYNDVSSSRKFLLSEACLRNAAGMSFEALPFFSFFMVASISSGFGGVAFIVLCAMLFNWLM